MIRGNCCGRHNNFICLWKFVRANRTTRGLNLTPATPNPRPIPSRSLPNPSSDLLPSPFPSRSEIPSSPPYGCLPSSVSLRARSRNRSDWRSFGGKRSISTTNALLISRNNSPSEAYYKRKYPLFVKSSKPLPMSFLRARYPSRSCFDTSS